MTHKPHDALFKAAFGKRAHARQLFRCNLPPSLDAVISWDTFAAAPGSFIGPSLGDRHADLLFSAKLERDGPLIYLLLEHQSTLDEYMPLRKLEYVTHVSKHHVQQHGGPLPWVLPLLVTHASGGWTAPLSFQQLLAPVPVPAVAPLLPHFSLLADDLTRLDNENLRARALSAFPTLALWSLRDSRNLDALYRNLEHWSDVFRQALQAPGGFESLGQLLRYYYLIIPQSQHARFRANILRQIPEVHDVERTIGEALIEEGLVQGREQGLVQGREQGLVQGRRQALAKQLALKFGPLPPHYAAQLQTATHDQIDLYLERVLFAPSLTDVFA